MVTATVLGTEQLRAKFAALPQAIRAEIRAAMEQGAAEVVAMARRLVPVDSGALRDSIGWTWGKPPGGSITVGKAKSGADILTIYAGNSVAYYVGMIEFGTLRQRAQAFFYPSWRSLKRRVMSRNNRALKVAAQKIARR